MSKTRLLFKLFSFLFFLTAVTLSAQNVILNSDFENNGGSLDNWNYTAATTLMIDNGNHYASLLGENGVLYQKVTNITPGLPYVCTINFRSLVVKQTTGYGFAIEKDTPLTIPTFTIGATNLRDFCNNNNGQWTEMSIVTRNADTDGSETYSYNVTIPVDATAIYICIGTKGAVAKLEVNTIKLEKDSNTQEVTFLINDTSNNPIENAAVSIESFPEPVLTDASGQVTVTLLLDTDYDYGVQKDYYQIYNSTLSVTASTNTVNVQLQDLVEVKDVQTRISTYHDNDTPYPIYAHLWNSSMNFTNDINKKIVSNFDYVIGGGDISGATNSQNSNFSADNLHAEDANFQVINYQGGWSEKSTVLDDKKIDLLYYRCGNVGSFIGVSDITFTINSPSDSKGLGLIASEPGNFTTWIRVGDELMKLVAVSSKTIYPITVTVERGMDGSIATSHTANSTVTAPLYTIPPVESGNNTNLSLFNPVFGPRKDILKQNVINYALNNNHDGIWIDILLGLLGGQNMTGGNYTLWNHKKEIVYTNEDIVNDTKEALNYIYEGFYAQLGYYPTIYGNNVLYDQSFTSSSRGYLMEKTTEFPKGLDGFCHENSWGHMSDDSGGIDNDGNPVSTQDVFRVASKYNNGRFLEWYMGNTWIDRCKAIALLAQRELPNQPMTINAGFKNQWFAYDLTDQARYDFNKYAYVSYLLSVHVDSNNKISSRMGISPMTDDGAGNIGVEIQPYFLYDIGVPTQSNNYTNFTNYRVASNNLYARKFSKGLVLINPFSTNMSESVLLTDITGNVTDIFIDPENNNEVITSIKLNSRESKLLINTSTASVGDENFEKNIKVFPNPTSEFLTIKLPQTIELNSNQITIELFNQLGVSINIKSKVTNGTTQINVSNLSAGIYFIKIKGIENTQKFIKY